MLQQSGTIAGNRQRHTRTINASPPTQANHAARPANGNPPTRPLYMHLARTHHTVPCATKAPATAWHPPRAQQGPARSTHTTQIEAPGQPLGAWNHTQIPQRQRTGTQRTKRTESEMFQTLNPNTHSYMSTRTGLAVCGSEDRSAGTHGARGGEAGLRLVPPVRRRGGGAGPW